MLRLSGLHIDHMTLSHKSDRFLYEFLDDGAKLAYVPVTLSKL